MASPAGSEASAAAASAADREAAMRAADERMEQLLGGLLRLGVLVAAAIVLCGGALYLLHEGRSVRSYARFVGEPAELRSVTGVLRSALALEGRALIQLGVLALIATPIVRVALSLVGFALQRDRMYILITLFVLTLLLLSLAGVAPA